MRILFVLIALSTVVLASTVNAVAVGQRTAASVYFRGHGGNVVCGAFSVSGAPTQLECGTVDQLTPAPPHPSAKTCGGLDFAGATASTPRGHRRTVRFLYR